MSQGEVIQTQSPVKEKLAFNVQLKKGGEFSFSGEMENSSTDSEAAKAFTNAVDQTVTASQYTANLERKVRELYLRNSSLELLIGSFFLAVLTGTIAVNLVLGIRATFFNPDLKNNIEVVD